MDNLYLISASILFSLQYIFSKKYQEKSEGTITASLVSSLMTSLFGALYCIIFAAFTGEEILFNISFEVFFYSMIYAVAGIVSGVTFLFALNYGNLSILTTFSLLGGMILPFFYGVLFNNEPFTVLKCVGTLILSVSLLPTTIENLKTNGTISSKARGSHILFPVFCFMVFVGNGMTAVISKIHQLYPKAVSSNAFVMIGSLEKSILSALIMVVYLLATRKKKILNAQNNKFSYRFILYLGFLLLCKAVVHSMGDVLSLLCAKTMDSSIQFSFISAFTILATALLGKYIFGEKIGKAQKISLVLVAFGITFMMLSSIYKI